MAVLAQGRERLPEFVVTARESAGLIIASRKRVGRNLDGPCNYISFREAVGLRRGASLLRSSLTAAVFLGLMWCCSRYLPPYLSVRTFYERGEQSVLFKVKWLGKEQTESMFSTSLALPLL